MMKITLPIFNYTLGIELTTKENAQVASLTVETKPIPYHLDIKNWYIPYACDFIVLNNVTVDMVIELEKYLSHLGMLDEKYQSYPGRENKAKIFHNEEDHTVRIDFRGSWHSLETFTNYLKHIQKHV